MEIREGAWVAVQVQTNREKSVASALKIRHYDPFLPLYTLKKRWFDRTVQLEIPLFAGYLFCRWILCPSCRIVDIPGVIRIVGGKQPLSVEDAEVEAIQRVVASGLHSRPWEFLRSGEEVRIIDGPLRGVDGILVRTDRSTHFVINVTILQRSVAVEIAPDCLRRRESLATRCVQALDENKSYKNGNQILGPGPAVEANHRY
jgi:transcription antitermination factor NusG